jgi:hypothetical protein
MYILVPNNKDWHFSVTFTMILKVQLMNYCSLARDGVDDLNASWVTRPESTSQDAPPDVDMYRHVFRQLKPCQDRELPRFPSQPFLYSWIAPNSIILVTHFNVTIDMHISFWSAPKTSTFENQASHPWQTADNVASTMPGYIRSSLDWRISLHTTQTLMCF